MDTRFIPGGKFTEENDTHYQLFKKAAEKVDIFSGVTDNLKIKQTIVGVYFSGTETVNFVITTEGLVSSAFLLSSQQRFTADMAHDGKLAPWLCTQVMKSLIMYRGTLKDRFSEKVS